MDKMSDWYPIFSRVPEPGTWYVPGTRTIPGTGTTQLTSPGFREFYRAELANEYVANVRKKVLRSKSFDYVVRDGGGRSYKDDGDALLSLCREAWVDGASTMDHLSSERTHKLRRIVGRKDPLGTRATEGASRRSS